MTASSVGLFACRVQPIGLPTGATASSTSTLSNAPFSNSLAVTQQQTQPSLPVRPIRPTAAAVRRVSRNLFGKPERSEIDQILRAEYERNCAKVLQRYNFDIETNGGSLDDNREHVTLPLPTLIAQELEQASKRQKKCNYSWNLLRKTIVTKTYY